MIAPCKDCVERFVGCHSACPRYAEFKAGCNEKEKIVDAFQECIKTTN